MRLTIVMLLAFLLSCSGKLDSARFNDARCSNTLHVGTKAEGKFKILYLSKYGAKIINYKCNYNVQLTFSDDDGDKMRSYYREFVKSDAKTIGYYGEASLTGVVVIAPYGDEAVNVTNVDINSQKEISPLR